MKIKIIILTVLFFFILSNEGSANVSHVVISEVQISGGKGKTKNDFIELYNPTDKDIDISRWKLRKKTKSRDSGEPDKESSVNVINKNTSILAGRYFLWANSKNGFSSSINADESTTATITSNNSIALFDSSSSLIDALAWGKGHNNPFVESIAYPDNPKDNQSLERKRVDGIIQDTDNNSVDFKIQCSPSPRNSKYDGSGKNDIEYSTEVRINELLPNPEGKDQDGEFIELYNYGNEDIDLRTWALNDKGGKSYKLSGKTINAYNYLAIDYKDSKISLNNTGDKVTLVGPDCSDVDKVSYKNVLENYSYSFDGKNWQWTPFITPDEENKFEEKKEYSNKVYLNEILPNPSGDEKTEEYIEVYNPTKNEINLGRWILRDSSKTGKYILPESAVIKASGYLIIYRADFKFALNNSGDETVYLLDPNENVVASVAYSKAKEDVSYNFDGEDWRWSRFLTPGNKNKFNKLPKIQVKIDKKIYKNVYANFEVKVNDPEKDKIKITWNFGDGRKSYKKKTRHKYKEKGKYSGSVKINDGSEDIIKKFNIKVKKFPRPKVRIVRISPNPKGKDSDFEWIEIKNKSKKDVNLKGWSIATGKSSKKLINHPIYEDFIIKSGKTKKLTRDICRFTLNNKKARIELRYPDGKVAHKAKYKREDGVKEDEIYEKIKGEGWKWSQDIGNVVSVESAVNVSIVETEEPFNSAQSREIYEGIPEEFLEGQSMDPNRKDFRTILASHRSSIKLYDGIMENESNILGASIIKENGSSYVFTKNGYLEEHYMISFLKSLGFKINSLVNRIILMLI